jgi:hypothetical protein
MADFLTANGIPTGWEATVNPLHPIHRPRDFRFLLRVLGLSGDSNWLAVAYLKRISPLVHILHQVRHPLKVVRSFLVLRFFGDDYLLKDMWQGSPRHTNLPRRCLPGLADLSTAMERCLFYWVRWNKLCEKHFDGRDPERCIRYRFEEVLDNSALPEIWRHVTPGRPMPEQLVYPPNANLIFGETEAATMNPVTWDMVPDGQLKSEARELAARYGYPE